VFVYRIPGTDFLFLRVTPTCKLFPDPELIYFLFFSPPGAFSLSHISYQGPCCGRVLRPSYHTTPFRFQGGICECPRFYSRYNPHRECLQVVFIFTKPPPGGSPTETDVRGPPRMRIETSAHYLLLVQPCVMPSLEFRFSYVLWPADDVSFLLAWMVRPPFKSMARSALRSPLRVVETSTVSIPDGD